MNDTGPESYLSVSVRAEGKKYTRESVTRTSRISINAHFFLSFLQIEQLRKASKFEDEIRMEQEERKREEEERAARREEFRQKAAIFGK